VRLGKLGLFLTVVILGAKRCQGVEEASPGYGVCEAVPGICPQELTSCREVLGEKRKKGILRKRGVGERELEIEANARISGVVKSGRSGSAVVLRRGEGKEFAGKEGLGGVI
jgi:hypothetical protein